jgi:hypothetical protein
MLGWCHPLLMRSKRPRLFLCSSFQPPPCHLLNNYQATGRMVVWQQGKAGQVTQHGWARPRMGMATDAGGDGRLDILKLVDAA